MWGGKATKMNDLIYVFSPKQNQPEHQKIFIYYKYKINIIFTLSNILVAKIK